MLIDVNASSRRVMRQLFTAWGMEAEIFESATEALDRMGTDGPVPHDALILDVRAHGTASTDLIARLARPGAPVKVVLMTDYAGVAEQILREIDPFATLARPIRPSVLFDCLAAIDSGKTDGKRFVPEIRVKKERPHFLARILVVEDNLVNQEVAVGTLEALGCQVVTVSSGDAALGALLHEDFDMILMDCEMPDMDGFEATRRIRSREQSGDLKPRDPHIIIALTAHVLAGTRERCLEAGMNDYLSKPFNEQQIAAVLGRWLPGRQQPMRDQGDAGESPSVVTSKAHFAPPSGTDRGETKKGDFDRSAMDAIRALATPQRPDLLDRVVGRFRDVTPRDIAAIGDGVSRRDAKAIRMASHSLKASAANLGLLRLADTARTIESLSAADDLDPIAPLVAELAQSYAAAEQILADFMKSTP